MKLLACILALAVVFGMASAGNIGRGYSSGWSSPIVYSRPVVYTSYSPSYIGGYGGGHGGGYSGGYSGGYGYSSGLSYGGYGGGWW